MRVSIIAAVTVDGFIGRDSNHLADWTSREDKKKFVELTKAAGVIVMGSKTFATIGRPLPGRRMVVYTNSPEKISDSRIETTNLSPSLLVEKLASEGATGLAVCGGTSVYSLFIESGVVDDIYLTIEPLLFGTGINLFGAHLEIGLELVESHEGKSGALFTRYKVNK